MRTRYFGLFLLLCAACGSPAPQPPAPVVLDIESAHFTAAPAELPTQDFRPIMELKGKTNLSAGTRIYARMSAPWDLSDTEIPTWKDTILVQDAVFRLHFPPAFVMSECQLYVREEAQADSVLESLKQGFLPEPQPESCPDCMYYRSFAVQYKTRPAAGEGSLPIPVQPLQLIIIPWEGR